MNAKKLFKVLGLVVVVSAPHVQAYYNATTGRWLSRDQLAETDSRNLFVVVDNCDVNNIDGLGMKITSTVPARQNGGRLPIPMAQKSQTQLEEFTQALERNKIQFGHELIALCPTCGDADFYTGEGRTERHQVCTLASCIKQAASLVDGLASRYKTVFTTEYKKWGNILTGLSGNERADKAPNHGEIATDADKGFGLKCVGWMDLSQDAFVEAIHPYHLKNSQCFRGARVGRPADGRSWRNHSWILIYGPERGQLVKSMYKKGDYDIAVDPWPVAGKTISRQYPDEAVRLDNTIMW